MKKCKKFTQKLVLEDAAFGRSTIKYTLFSRGRTKTHHPSPKSWVLSKLLGGVWKTISNHLQPSPTWFVELQPILGNLEGLEDVKRPKQGKQVKFFFAAKNQMKNLPGGYSSINSPEIGPPKSYLEELLVIPNLAFSDSPPEMFFAPRISPKTWKFGKRHWHKFQKKTMSGSHESHGPVKSQKKMVQFPRVLVNPPTKVNPISNCVSRK